MDREAVQPLRILKGSSNSPSKMPGSLNTRPLAEVNPMGIRRNSGNQSASPQSQKHEIKRDSSPFDPTPGSNSTLAFWKNKETLSPSHFGNENVPFLHHSPSPERRPSLENLKKASRVHNNIFARDHDQDVQSQPLQSMERPFRGRPLGARPESGGSDKNSPSGGTVVLPGPFRGIRELETRIPWLGQTTPPKWSPTRPTAIPKEQVSPTKSSLSSNTRHVTADRFADVVTPYSDDESSEMVGEATTPRPITRHPKSVSFDVAPPQINEYEEITPDPSSVASGSREGSYDSDMYEVDDDLNHEQQHSIEDSFAESLEDVEKTPVVMSEDWRFMSPEAVNTDLAETFDDPFGSQTNCQTSTNRRRVSANNASTLSRSDSIRSNGEHRPLPPLPGSSTDSATLSHLIPHASITPKSIRSLPTNSRIARDSPMPWEDRFRLLPTQNDTTNVARISANETDYKTDELIGYSIDQVEKDTEPVKVKLEKNLSVFEYQPPSLISRESILRKVRSNQSCYDAGYDDYSFAEEVEEEDEEVGEEKINYNYGNLDPDVPIPSCEGSDFHDEERIVQCVDEEQDQETGRSFDESEASIDEDEGVGNKLRTLHQKTEASDIQNECQLATDQDHLNLHKDKLSVDEVESPNPVINRTSLYTTCPTNRENSTSLTSGSLPNIRPQFGEALEHFTANHLAIPEFASFVNATDFGLGLESYLSSSAIVEPEQIAGFDRDPIKKDHQICHERPMTPLDQIDRSMDNDDYEGSDEITTPSSVIHYTVEIASDTQESPIIPEPIATIKAPGAKLKTRPSATPADVYAMAAARRLVSEEKPLPFLPLDGEQSEEEQSEGELDGGNHGELEDEELNEKVKCQNTSYERIPSVQVRLDIPFLGSHMFQRDLGIEEELDRVVETQKVEFSPYFQSEESTSTAHARIDHFDESMPLTFPTTEARYANVYKFIQRGYIMRENEKVVVASNRQISDSTTSIESVGKETQPTAQPRAKRIRKPSQQTWKTEPWNGRTRRQSTRLTSIVPEKPTYFDPAPPLPGTESAASGDIDNMIENEAPEQDYDTDGAERGRLFVKVVGVKELDLPLPKDERCHFQLTLDNGLHCVTTNWAELGRTAPVGQEFELVVFEDLEFQLTLQTRLERPKSIAPSVDISTTCSTKTSKTSKIKNFLRSPQKRRELEQKQREEEEAFTIQQRQREVDQQRASYRPTAWDLQHEIVGSDGSFARAYVSLSSHEKQAFGRPYNVDIPCFNEWAVEDRSITSSTRSKLGGIQRRPPYKIGKIELQLLYIPKPRGIQDEDMPRSISAALRQLKEAESVIEQQYEGVLSQQGGDCPFWRRRFFKLQGNKLAAYHESTRQLRATINLSKAIQLVDDRRSLTQTVDLSTSPTKGCRRKSGFAKDEEGYMFVEEGFRIRFANGEDIDFYADNAQQKEHWMAALTATVGKNGAAGKVSWMDVVLARERTQKAREALEKPNRLKEENLPIRGSSKPVPASPVRKPVGRGGETSNKVSERSMPATGRDNHATLAPTSPSKHWSLPIPKSQENPLKRVDVIPEGERKAVRSMLF